MVVHSREALEDLQHSRNQIPLTSRFHFQFFWRLTDTIQPASSQPDTLHAFPLTQFSCQLSAALLTSLCLSKVAEARTCQTGQSFSIVARKVWACEDKAGQLGQLMEERHVLHVNCLAAAKVQHLHLWEHRQ